MLAFWQPDFSMTSLRFSLALNQVRLLILKYARIPTSCGCRHLTCTPTCVETSLAVDSLTKGAKHKLKEKEKQDKKQDGPSQHTEGDNQVSTSPSLKQKGEKEKKKKKKSKEDKAKNGVDAIKRPLSAYMLFNNHRRPILKKEHISNTIFFHFYSDLSLPEVSKMIGEEWSKLTIDQKKVIKDLIQKISMMDAVNFHFYKLIIKKPKLLNFIDLERESKRTKTRI